MKAGTLIFVMVVILIAFGYVISDSLRAHQDVQELTDQIGEMNGQVEQARAQLVACQDQGEKDGQTIQDLQSKIDSLDAEIRSLNGMLAKLNTENALYAAQGSLLDLLRTNPLLLIGALITPVAASTIRYNKKLGIRLLGVTRPQNDEYVRLSKEEREWVIATRRNKKNRSS